MRQLVITFLLGIFDFIVYNSPEFVERWPSGRRRSPAKGVYPNPVSRVRIPPSPPFLSSLAHSGLPLDGDGRPPNPIDIQCLLEGLYSSPERLADFFLGNTQSNPQVSHWLCAPCGLNACTLVDVTVIGFLRTTFNSQRPSRQLFNSLLLVLLVLYLFT